jgi:hypothetical protein
MQNLGPPLKYIRVTIHDEKNVEKYRRHVRFEVFTAVIMKNGVFWNVTPCDSCKNRHFGGTYHLFHQGDKKRCC